MDIIANLMARLGLTPEAVETAKLQAQQVVNDARRVRDEVLAAKAGFQAATQHFDARLARLEAKIDRLAGPKANGSDTHEPLRLKPPSDAPEPDDFGGGY
jgi:hypothetical protein